MAAPVTRVPPRVPDAQVEANVLKALASADDLAGQPITTRTVYGTVTLSGSVADEARRLHAESLAANAPGVVKVVDELQLSTAAEQVQPGAADAAPVVLQSDGTYAPAQQDPNQPEPGSAPAAGAVRNDPDADQELDRQQAAQQAAPADISQPQQAPVRRPLGSDGIPGPPAQQQPAYGAYPTYAGPAYPAYGRPGGQSVTIPAGALLRVRVSRTLASDLTPAGTAFDGIVTNDVVAGGAIAIPRGASVEGRVVDSIASGHLKGRGELRVTLTSVTLGGRVYPIVSDVWARHGGDKTIETVNKTAGFGAIGAVLGAVYAGGAGAAVGGGLGAAAGLGSSATSGNGQVGVPAEGTLAFHLTQAATVQTVSDAEMQRLASGSAPMRAPQVLARRRPVGVYLGPGWGYPLGYPVGYPVFYPTYGYPGPYPRPYGYPSY